MPRITPEELLERRVSELKEAETEKKKELSVIQRELKKDLKALEILTEASEPLRATNSDLSRPRARRKKPDEKERATDNPVSQM